MRSPEGIESSITRVGLTEVYYHMQRDQDLLNALDVHGLGMPIGQSMASLAAPEVAETRSNDIDAAYLKIR